MPCSSQNRALVTHCLSWLTNKPYSKGRASVMKSARKTYKTAGWPFSPLHLWTSFFHCWPMFNSFLCLLTSLLGSLSLLSHFQLTINDFLSPSLLPGIHVQCLWLALMEYVHPATLFGQTQQIYLSAARVNSFSLYLSIYLSTLFLQKQLMSFLPRSTADLRTRIHREELSQLACPAPSSHIAYKLDKEACPPPAHPQTDQSLATT